MKKVGNFILYLIYIFCFMTFQCIEVNRFSYLTEVTITPFYVGALMMLIVLSGYGFRQLFTITNGIYTGIYAILSFCGYKFHWWYWFIDAEWKFTYFLINIWWMVLVLIMLIASLVKKERKIEKVPYTAILLIIFSLVSIFSKDNYYEQWIKWFIPYFLCFYVTEYTKERKEILMHGMMDGSILTFIIIQLYAFYRWPFLKAFLPRYGGFFYNSNIAAVYYTIIFVLIVGRLIKSYKENEHWLVKALIICIAGVNLALQGLTLTRGAVIVSLLVILLTAVFFMYRHLKMKALRVVAVWALTLAVAAASFMPCFYAASYLPRIYMAKTGNSIDDSLYVSWRDFKAYFISDRGIESLNNNFAMIGTPFAIKGYVAEAQVAPVEEKNLVQMINNIASGRLGIYWAHIRNFNLTGHTVEDRNVSDPQTADFLQYHAHNILIEAGYVFGVPALILLTALLLIVFIKKIINYIKDEEKTYSFIALLIVLAFLLYGMTDRSWEFNQISMVMFLFVQHPTLFGGKSFLKGDKE